ncbi:MAG: endo-1,4-beta-xylanase, partial [Myxococcota bacterium]
SASGTYGGGVLTGVHVRGNLIVESTYPNKRFPGMLQGIAFFDGIYKNYRIHHNVVVVDHWHGISLHGSEGSSIYQNTVVDARPGTGGKPWIQVGNHKNGTVNSATRVYRNVTASLNPIGAVDSYDNEIVGSSAYENHFRDPVNHDWRLAVPSQRGASMGRLFMSDTLMGVGARSSVALGTSMSRQTCHLSPSDPLCDGVLSDLDMFTLGNPLKWGALRRVEGQYNFADADRMLDFAAGNGLSVHGHTLVWTVDNPAWLEAYRGNSTALEALMREHISTVITRYRNRNPGVVRSWDVVNEPFYSVTGVLQKPEHRIWAGIKSHLGHDQYIKIAYEEAHRADPDAHLVINDYNIISGPKADGMFNLVANLRAQGIPIHGVGFQLHYDLSDGTGGSIYSVADLRAAIRRYENIGVKAHITELGVRATTPTSNAESLRASEAYFNAARACALEPNCESLTLWDLSSADSWINSFFEGYTPESPLDDDYRKTPNYWAVMEGLR